MYRVLFPQGGLEPPQSEPESEVLPLHNRGMQCKSILANTAKYVNSKKIFFLIFFQFFWG